MHGKAKQHTILIISTCVIFALLGIFITFKKLNAQGVPPPVGAGSTMPGAPMGAGSPMMGMPGMPGMMGMGTQQTTGGSAEVAPIEPKIKFTALVRGVQPQNIKNWDGTITPILRFKYRLGNSKVLTVHLPKALINEDRTKNGWETLFQAYDMTIEAVIDEEIKNNPTPVAGSTTTGIGGTMRMPGIGGIGAPIGGMMPMGGGGVPPTVAGSPGGSMPVLPGMPVR